MARRVFSASNLGGVLHIRSLTCRWSGVFVLVGVLGSGIRMRQSVTMPLGFEVLLSVGRRRRVRPVRCDWWWCGVCGDGVAGVEPGFV